MKRLANALAMQNPRRPQRHAGRPAQLLELLESRLLLSVVLTGDNNDNTFLIRQDGTGYIDFYTDGVLQAHQPVASVDNIVVSGLGGNDTLIVDSTNGLIAVPGGITYDGGAGFDSLVLTGGSVDASSHVVGPALGSGVSTMVLGGAVQQVSYSNIEPLSDNVPAATATVNGTNADNAINYTAGPGGGIFTGNTGLISVDGQETYEFNNKTNLVINGLAGSDTINLNDPTTPAGLTGTITVNGGDPSGSNKLIVNGIAGALDNLRFVPTAAEAGNVINDNEPQPQVNFTGIGHLQLVVQQTDGDGFRIDGTTGNDHFVFTSGLTADSGVFTGTMDSNNATGSGPFEMTETTFTGASPLANDVDVNFFNPGGTDSFEFNGTPSNDTIGIQSGEAGGAEFRNTVNGVVAARLEVFNTQSYTARGLAGDDVFNVQNNAMPGAGVLNIEQGDSSGAGTVNLTADNTNATTLVIGSTSTVTGGSLDTVNMTGNSIINLLATNDLTITGSASAAENFSIVPAASTATTTVTGGGLTVTAVSKGNLTLNGGGSAGDTLTSYGLAGSLDNIRYVPTAAGAGMLINDNLHQPPQVTFSGISNLSLVLQQSDGDGVRVDGTAGNDNFVFTPGLTADSGVFTGTMDTNNATGSGPFEMTEMTYQGVNTLANDVDLNFFSSPGGTDNLLFNGTAGNDTIAVGTGEAGGAEFRNTINGQVVARIEFFNAASATVRGLGGNDVFNHSLAITIPVSYEGDSSASDVINVTGTGAPLSATLGNTTDTVSGAGPGIVSLTGVAVENLAADDASVTILGTAGDDSLQVTPSTTGGLVTRDGTNLSIVVTGVDGDFTIDGAGGTNTVTLNGSSAADAITLTGGATSVAANVNGNQAVTLPNADTQALVVDAGLGDDTLTVDSSAFPVHVPVTYNGGLGADALVLQGGEAVSDTYSPGPQLGSGSSTIDFGGAGIQVVNFVNLEPVFDQVLALNLVVNGTTANDSINYQEGSSSPGVTDATWGEVTVNNLEAYEFTNKVNLVINALAGSNTINLKNPFTPTGLTAVTVNGDAAAADSLVVNGTAASDNFALVTSGAAAGTLTVNSELTVNFTAIGNLALHGLDGGDTFILGGTPALAGPVTLDGGTGDDTFDIGAYTGLTVLTGGGGSDTMDFFNSPMGVAINLDQIGVNQVLNSSGATVKLTDTIANFIGSDFNDTVTVTALGVAQSIVGGDPALPGAGSPGAPIPPGDRLIIDAQGQTAKIVHSTVDTGTVTVFGLAPISFTGIESFKVTNNAGTAGWGTGASAFNPAVGYGAASGANDAAVGDVNDDGIPDLVVPGVNKSGQAVVSILLGNGNGTYAPAYNVLTLPGGAKGKSVSVQLADVNNNGELDIVVANSKDSISILLGNGDGTFASPLTYSTYSTPKAKDGRGPAALAIGFFNGDGNLDIVTANKSSNTLSVFMGNGDGTFGVATVYSTGGTSAGDVDLQDVNNDGHVDILAANTTSVGVLLNNGAGVFGLANPKPGKPRIPTSVVKVANAISSLAAQDNFGNFIDVNQDGIPDIVLSNKSQKYITVLLGNGTGGFTVQNQAAYENKPISSVQVADVNGDGKADLVLAAPGRVVVLLGIGNGTFTAPFIYNMPNLNPAGANSIKIADLNGDGTLDLVVMNSKDNFVNIMLRNTIV